MFKDGKTKDETSKALDPQFPSQMMESLKNLKREINNPPLQTAQNSHISSSSTSSQNTCVQQSSSPLIHQPPATKEREKIDPMEEAVQNLLQNAAQNGNAAQNNDGNDITQTNQPIISKPNCFKSLKDIQLTHHKEPKEPFILEDEGEESEEAKQQRLSRLRRFAQQRNQPSPFHSGFKSFMSKVKQVPDIIAEKLIKNKNELMIDSADKKINREIPIIVKKQASVLKSKDAIINEGKSEDFKEPIELQSSQENYQLQNLDIFTKVPQKEAINIVATDDAQIISSDVSSSSQVKDEGIAKAIKNIEIINNINNSQKDIIRGGADGIEKDDEVIKQNKTAKKPEWEKKEVIVLLDNFIIHKTPKKLSTLLNMLKPHFAGGQLGRSTVRHHVTQRTKKIEQNRQKSRIPQFNEKAAVPAISKKRKVISPKKSFVGESVEEIQNEVLKEYDAVHDEQCLDLLNHQINAINALLQEPQSSKRSAALENLLKRLVEAKEEYQNIMGNDAFSFNDIDFEDYEVQQPPIKQKRLGGKRQITRNFYIGLNERLNKNLLIFDESEGFVREFCHETTKTGVKYYICSRCRNSDKAEKKCRAQIHTSGEIFVDDYHDDTCAAIPKLMSDAWQAQRIASVAAAEGKKINTAYNEGFKNALSNKAQVGYGSYGERMKNLSRWRGRYFPNCLKGEIMNYYLDLLIPSRRWMIAEDQSIAIFATDNQLRAMANALVLQADSTFSITPQGYTQTLFMHALIESNQGEHWVPSLMAIMDGKNEENYNKVVDEIKRCWAELQMEPKFGRIHTDYEEAESNAFKKLAGPEKVRGCLFHYSQCLLRNAFSYGLFPFYMITKQQKTLTPEQRRIRTWIRSLMALPFLPPKDCKEFAKILCKVPPKPETTKDEDWPAQALQKLVNYMEKNWLNRTDNMWNFYDLERVRNTNRCEGFHSGFKKRFDQNPKLKVFMDEMKLYFTQVETELERIGENRQRSYRNKVYKELDDRLWKYEEKFRIDIMQAKTEKEKMLVRYRHCRQTSYLLQEVRNKSCNTVKSEKKSTKAEAIPIWDNELKFLFPNGIDETKTYIEIFEDHEDVMFSLGEIQDDFDQIINDSFNVNEMEAFNITFDDEDRAFDNQADWQNTSFENQREYEMYMDKPVLLNEYSNQPQSSKHPKPATPYQSITNKSDSSIIWDSPFPKYIPMRPGGRPGDGFTIPFNPPSLGQIQECLRRLQLDQRLAMESPLLNSPNCYYNEHTIVKGTAKGDGSCLWRSFAKLVTGREDDHWNIRLRTYEHIIKYGQSIPGIENQETVRFYQKAYNELKKSTGHRVNRVYWGGNRDLYGLSNLIGMNIWMRSPQTSRFDFNPHLIEYEEGILPRAITNVPNLFIDFVNDDHFEPIFSFV